MSETRTLQQQQLDHLYGLDVLAVPVSVYFSAWTTKPALDGTGGVEVTGGAYGRVAVAANSTNFSRDGQVVSNVNQIEWDPATADWGTIVAVGIHHSVSGALEGIGDLATPQTVDDGETFYLPAGTGFSHQKIDPS